MYSFWNSITSLQRRLQTEAGVWSVECRALGVDQLGSLAGLKSAASFVSSVCEPTTDQQWVRGLSASCSIDCSMWSMDDVLYACRHTTTQHRCRYRLPEYTHYTLNQKQQRSAVVVMGKKLLTISLTNIFSYESSLTK